MSPGLYSSPSPAVFREGSVVLLGDEILNARGDVSCEEAALNFNFVVPFILSGAKYLMTIFWR